jgi:polyketide synthase 12
VEPPLVPLGPRRAERADAARNRLLLLDAARAMIAEVGADKVTMDGLAERAGLGKGTVFRRFGTRAGIFHALLDEEERLFQERVLSGPPPLGPGADPVERLVVYGQARIAWLLERHALARASLDRARPVPAGTATLSQLHVRVLLRQAGLGVDDVDSLAVQLTAALEGPVLLYLSLPEQADTARDIERLAGSWQVLVERLCRV